MHAIPDTIVFVVDVLVDDKDHDPDDSLVSVVTLAVAFVGAAVDREGSGGGVSTLIGTDVGATVGGKAASLIRWSVGRSEGLSVGLAVGVLVIILASVCFTVGLNDVVEVGVMVGGAVANAGTGGSATNAVSPSVSTCVWKNSSLTDSSMVFSYALRSLTLGPLNVMMTLTHCPPAGA